jgi:hypothetical protein
VPNDVSVAGFDDIPVAAYVTPPLTTVRQPFDAVATAGLRLLVHAIEQPHEDPPPTADHPVELVVRASTAPPPGRPRDVGARPLADQRRSTPRQTRHGHPSGPE